MNSWEKHIQERLGDVEGTPSTDAWNNIQHKLDHPFEASIQKKVGDVVVPSLSPQLWAGISGSLSGAFESQIKEKVDAYANVPPSAIWENIDASIQSKGVFDEAVAEKVRHTDASPPANGWGYISRQLDAIIAAKRRRQIATWAALFLCAIIPSSNVMQQWWDGENERFANVSEINEAKPLGSSDAFPSEKGAYHSKEENKGNSQILDYDDEKFANSNEAHLEENGKDRFNTSGHKNSNDGQAFISSSKNSSKLPPKGNRPSENNNGGNGLYGESIGLERLKNDLVVSLKTLHTNAHDGLVLEGFQPEWKLSESITNPVAEALKKIKRNTQIVMFSMSSGSFQERYNAPIHLKDFAQFTDSLDGTGWSTSAGASFGFSLSKKLLLTTGLNLTYATKQTNFSVRDTLNQPTTSSSYKTGNYSGGPESLQQSSKGRSVLGLVDEEITGTIIPGTDRVLHSHYTWVSIPVGLRFEQPISKNINVSAGIGVEGQLLLNAHTFVPTVDKYGFTEIDPTFANEFYRPNLNGLGNIGINYSFSEAFGVELGVYHNRALTSISSGNDYISPLPFQSGIRLSIIQRL